MNGWELALFLASPIMVLAVLCGGWWLVCQVSMWRQERRFIRGIQECCRRIEASTRELERHRGDWN